MHPLTIEGLNPALLKVQYAVRGELAIKAEILRDKLNKEPDHHGLPFDKVISSNIGNPQQKGLDQPPITFTRQVRKKNSFFFITCNRSYDDDNRSLRSWNGRI